MEPADVTTDKTVMRRTQSSYEVTLDTTAGMVLVPGSADGQIKRKTRRAASV